MSKKGTNIIDLSDFAASRNQELISAAFVQHEQALRNYLRGRLASQADREDIIQDVFVRLAQQNGLQERLSHGENKTRAYLMVIASNLIRDKHRRDISRKTKFHENADDLSLQNRMPIQDDILGHRQTLRQVRTVLDKLPPKCRAAFTMSRFESMSYADIARKLNVSTSMIEKYIAKALIQLRKNVDFDESQK